MVGDNFNGSLVQNNLNFDIFPHINWGKFKNRSILLIFTFFNLSKLFKDLIKLPHISSLSTNRLQVYNFCTWKYSQIVPIVEIWIRLYQILRLLLEILYNRTMNMLRFVLLSSKALFTLNLLITGTSYLSDMYAKISKIRTSKFEIKLL